MRGQQAGSVVFTSRQNQGPCLLLSTGEATPGGFSSPETHTMCAAPGAGPWVSDKPMLKLGKQWDRTVDTRRLAFSVGGKEMSPHINSICSVWNILLERCEKQETMTCSLQHTPVRGRLATGPGSTQLQKRRARRRSASENNSSRGVGRKVKKSVQGPQRNKEGKRNEDEEEPQP